MSQEPTDAEYAAWSASQDDGHGVVVNMPGTAATTPLLQFQTLAELSAEVDALGPRRWLIRGVWPQGAYGVHGAEPKAGKTWTALDLAVSVASGTPWLETYPIDDPGPVIVFAGEGGKGTIVRRLRAIAAARGVTAEELHIVVCTRAPHLNDIAHLHLLKEALELYTPRLVILDPLYLSARGADSKDLYSMGAVLEAPQLICEAIGAALLVVTHFNRARDLKGAARFTGAGPAEWGRVLIAASIVSRHTDPATRATTTVTEVEVTGGEVPDGDFRLVRTIAAVDPDDLDSALTYSVRTEEPSSSVSGETDDESGLHPAARKLLEAVQALGSPSTIPTVIDKLASLHGHGLTRQTASTQLNALAEKGLIDRIDQGSGRSVLWVSLPVGGVA